MESIIVFVVIMALNIILKSVGDKKKIEEARRKRAQQLKNKPLKKDTLNKTEEVRESWIKEAKKNQGKIESYSVSDPTDKKNEEKSWNIYESTKESNAYDQDEIKELNIDISINKKDINRSKLVNALIWSEILSEPKSVQNAKRRI